MARGPEVLKSAMHDANLLVSFPSLGPRDQIGSLLKLAEAALAAGDGEVADSLVRGAGLHESSLADLGLALTS